MEVGVHDLRLTWVNYSQKLSEAFNRFLSNQSLCNVTLSVGRRSIKCHQAILSACSTYFEAVLMENEHPHPIVIIKDVAFDTIKNILKFMYTGEVSVPQHELQEFLRTAEQLEIKGLLSGVQDVSTSTSLHAILPSATIQQARTLQPTAIVNPVTITDAGLDLVSQIKVPISPAVSPQAAAPIKPFDSGHHPVRGKKRKKKNVTEPESRLSSPSAQKKGVQLHIENDGGAVGTSTTLKHTPGVPWCSSGGEAIAHPQGAAANTPHRLASNGVDNCGAFKRAWAERYLCYNLGCEIICLLCFCRFTQFKKFNLERHMKNKHPKLYNLPDPTRKLILERFVSQYEAHLTPGMISGVPAHGNTSQASQIMAVGPIQLDDLDLDPSTEEELRATMDATPSANVEGVATASNFVSDREDLDSEQKDPLTANDISTHHDEQVLVEECQITAQDVSKEHVNQEVSVKEENSSYPS